MTGSVPAARRPRPASVVAAIVAAELRRSFRDRTALFFLLVMPVVVIIIIGAAFGEFSDEVPIGVIDRDRSPESRALVAALGASDALDVRAAADAVSMRRDVRTAELDAGVVIERGFGRSLRQGDRSVLTLVTDPADADAAAIRASVFGVAARQGAEAAARRFVVARAHVDAAVAEAVVSETASRTPTVDVDVDEVGARVEESVNRYSYTAPSNLVLFVFINTMALGGALIETRRLGVLRRMLAAPAPRWSVAVGIGASRFVLALVQAALVLVIGAVAFGVSWGDPLGAALLVVAFSLVATGTGVVVGTTAASPQLAQATGIPVAIGMAMLGGCMWPLEIVPDTMRIVGHISPHAWAMDGWLDLVYDGDGLTAVLPEVGVLLAMAAALLAVGARRLGRITSA